MVGDLYPKSRVLWKNDSPSRNETMIAFFRCKNFFTHFISRREFSPFLQPLLQPFISGEFWRSVEWQKAFNFGHSGLILVKFLDQELFEISVNKPFITIGDVWGSTVKGLGMIPPNYILVNNILLEFLWGFWVKIYNLQCRYVEWNAKNFIANFSLLNWNLNC